MDSESFIGDFNVGLPLDNRYMNQLMGGMGGALDANDLMNPSGLDFSMMADTSASLVGPPGSSTGMIDFPEELNNNPIKSSGPSASGVVTSSAATSSGGSEAIPFPAALASEPSISMGTTTAANPVPTPATMNGASFNGLDLTGNHAMNGNMAMNPGMNVNLGMNMGMNAGMAPNFMPDMNMGLAMNPMFMNGGYPMQQQQQQAMMMNMNAAQMYFPQQQQQQQQEYLRMMQQRQAQLQYAQQLQQATNTQAQAQALANNPAAAAQLQLQRQQQQLQALQQQMALQNGSLQASNGQTQQRQAPPNQSAQPNQQAQNAAAQRQPAVGTGQQPSRTLGNSSATPIRQPWHSSADNALRKEMLNHIMRVLQSQKSNAPTTWLQRLPEMARRLEEECYRISESRDEYANTSTLQGRLKNIVRMAQIKSKTGATSQAGGTTTTATTTNATTAAPIPFPGSEAVSQPPAPPVPVPAVVPMNPAVAQPIQMPPELQRGPAAPPPTASVKVEAIPMPLELQNPAVNQNAGTAAAAAAQNRSSQFLLEFKARAQLVTSALEEKQTRDYHNKLMSMTSSGIMNANSKGVLQKQQQRLLLLRHAMWCKAPEGTCTATPSCGEMKRLWQHMGNCQETTPCTYSHCISSKYVLSHFQQCENRKCLVCQLLRFPIEVKEKDGSLMMDADRALQQIQAANERRLAQARGGSNPAEPASMNGNGGMPQQQQQQPAPVTMATSQPASLQPRPATTATASSVPGLTEEENRQLGLIQERLRSVNLEQLNQNSNKLERYAEQIRAQVNAIMNECRQLMQMRNSTQDPALQSQYDGQVQAKKLTLQDLHQRYKKCTSQHRIVRHVISARIAGGGGGAAATQPPPQPVSQPAPVVTQQPLAPVNYGQMPFPVSMQPLAMPPGLQGPPPQPLSMPPALQQQPQPPAMPQSFTGQLMDPMLQQGLHPGMTSNGMSANGMSTNGMMGNGMMGNGLMGKGAALFAAKPLEMPSDLQPAPVQPSIAAPVEPPSVNPLTMNNSKLNAMMMEHKRIKAESPVVDVKMEAVSSAAPSLSPSVSASAPGATTGDVPTSMLNELTNEQLAAHIDSLVRGYNATMQPAVMKKRMEGLLKGMMEHKFGWVFSSPVDPVALQIPNYFKIIRRPMDLGTIKKKLDAGVYKHMDQFALDVRTTFENAKTYNSEDQDVYNLAKDMLNDFNAEMRKVEAEAMEEERQARAKENACRLCGVERMVFEPAVLYCNGECNSRIRRNCYYFCSPDNKYHCCQPCFTNLADGIRGNEGKTYRKAELAKKKNDEVHEEPWVQCDSCNRWVHQICALFNGKIDAEKKPQVVKSESGKTASGPSSSSSNGTSQSSSSSSNGSSSHTLSTTPGNEFMCPECLLEHRVKEPQKFVVGKHAFNAKDLMRTKLSDFLERRIYKALQEEREDEARWTHRAAKDVATAEHLTVRLVSNIEKPLMVRDKLFQRYKDPPFKYTSEHRFKSKCICMFQEIHGVSVLLFGMYVHEFDEQEAPCNARRVYISYLDSVNYFEPAHLRTKVYHELLMAYLEFVRQRGFHTAHLWACPPLKGDDYILYCHPEAQKTPKSDRLRQWYVDMLTKAQEQGVALHISNLYDEYWRDDQTACALPYFEGDYWVGLAEEVIEKLDAEKPKKPKKGSNKRKGSGDVKKMSKKAKSKKIKRRKTSEGGGGGDDAATGSDGEGDGGGEDGDDEETEENGGAAVAVAVAEKKERPITSLEDVDRTVTDPLMKKMGEVIEPMKDDFLVVKLQPYCRVCNTPVLQGKLWKDPTVKTELGLNPKIVQTTVCDACYVKASAMAPSHPRLREQLSRLVAEDVTWPDKCTDPDDINDSEYFDTRQAFLSLCQGNHYQFDELRRAKHSSMMALYHLGNPNPNAYVYECNACTRDIVTGNRWHCHTCPDFDVCDDCHEKEPHEHQLEMIPTSGITRAANGQSHGALTDEQRRQREQRAKNVRLHMELLVHASKCDGGCGSTNCEKMKELMRHGSQCKLRALGGCTVCRRVWALLQLHARQCRQRECKVPRCHDLREHVRKLQLQQQLMDDRRRAAVTQQYRQMQNGGAQPAAAGGDDESANA